MDSGGLVLSAPSLLIELVKQSIAAYKLFLDGKNLEKSMAHFSVRLSIEHQRLTQWGEGSGLFAPEGHSQLFTDPRLIRNQGLLGLVQQILRSIKEILEDVGQLTKKYGLLVLDPAETSEARPATSEVPVAEEDENLDQATKKSTKKRPAMEMSVIAKKVKVGISRLRWAVEDKEAFETLLGQLKHYNDSLYDLLPLDVRNTFSRDVLANLIYSATNEALKDYRGMSRVNTLSSTASTVSNEPLTYSALSSAATIEIALRDRSQLYENGSTGPNFEVPSEQLYGDDLTEDSIHGGRIASWVQLQAKRRRIKRVFIEEKALASAEPGFDPIEKQNISTQHKFAHGLDSVKRLVELLHQVGSTSAFRTLRCVGVSKKGRYILRLLYELPDWVNADVPPWKLHTLMAERKVHGIYPSMTVRLKLAKNLAAGLFQLHSSSWMHKEISSHNVVFFQRCIDPPKTEPCDLLNPFICGFKHARHAMRDISQPLTTPMDHFEHFKSRIHIHPSYLFHKGFIQGKLKNGGSLDAQYYYFKHDYYSLGLLLLEIGMWQPLEELDVLAPPDLDNLLRNKTRLFTKFWQAEVTTAVGSNLQQSAKEGWDTFNPDGLLRGLESFTQALKDAAEGENIQDVFSILKEPLEDKAGLQRLMYDWFAIYPFELFRQSAIMTAEKHLAFYMGDEYQKLVLRCLRSDFGLPRTALESDWLKGFNWLVVKELEERCL
ncbi:hypothetical protein PT974_07350 [Cladobotryum mycophilum]|uniref:Protein kinase domain-containing protein n=1 Tax=Cladobotryum mycophilum TaxID=491253 RepID=A0ABR0SP13_9HYPO